LSEGGSIAVWNSWIDTTQPQTNAVAKSKCGQGLNPEHGSVWAIFHDFLRKLPHQFATPITHQAPRCLLFAFHHSSSEKEHLTSSSPRGTSSSSTIFWYATYGEKCETNGSRHSHVFWVKTLQKCWEKRKPGKKEIIPKWCFNLMLPSSPNMDIYSYYMILKNIYIYICVCFVLYVLYMHAWCIYYVLKVSCIYYVRYVYHMNCIDYVHCMYFIFYVYQIFLATTVYMLY